MAARRKKGLRINARLELPERELSIEGARSGGPGGQNVNKVESKVILRFSVEGSRTVGERRKERLLDRLAGRLNRRGELVIHASRFRERKRNEEDARERLAHVLRDALRTPRKRKKTRPSRASNERRLTEKKQRSAMKRARGGIDEE